ncbi:hypothetical protein PENSPDRAFT_690754 [Peniophora sp. CONT]|nr:hypothetical protein PENSPDRAFT_690754 [Peniophora sp. CONT]
MSGSQICDNYYALATESHSAARRALEAGADTMSPAGLTASLKPKYRMSQAEYRLRAARLQDIMKHSREITPEGLISGLREEAARFVLISGHLGLLDILPTDLTRLLGTRSYQAEYGAAELLLHSGASGYFPGFVDDPKEPDLLPSLRLLQQNSDLYSVLLKAGQLSSADDCSWWNSEVASASTSRSSVLRAADAAECILRMPQMIWKQESRRAVPQSQVAIPRPLGHVVELLQALTQMEETMEAISLALETYTRRRHERLLLLIDTGR